MHTIHNDRWNKDNGNEFLVANYPLDENSWVIELGGYKGEWTNKIVGKYKSNILVVEPIAEFCKSINEIHGQNPKVRIENNGISTEERTTKLSFNGDASSEYLEPTDEKREIKCYTLEQYLIKYNIQKVDLMQVNIEGEEYPLFEEWLKRDILKNFNYIQIQFHRVGNNYEERRLKIHSDMKKIGFELRWDYDYVFESWKNKNWV